MENSKNFYYSKDYANSFLNIIFLKLLNSSKRLLANEKEIENNEKYIRNKLFYDYLNNNYYRKILEIDIKNIIFTIEAPELINYKEQGYVDFKVYNAIQYSHDTNAYFVIECKRIDGTSNLNHGYVQEGILRFVNQKYPSNYCFGGMFGFVVKKIDIDNNVNKINGIIKNKINKNCIQYINKCNDLKNYKYFYSSIFTYKKKSNNNLRIYHLMFNFSDIIQINS